LLKRRRKLGFLDLRVDYALKRVFGNEENSEVLINFLNSIIDFPKHKRVVDVEIVNPYNIKALKDMEDTSIDIKAELNDKSQIIIEINVLNYEGFEKKVLYNLTKNYSSQLTTRNYHLLFNPVIVITIVDFVMFHFDKVVSYFKLLEKSEHTGYLNDLELIFIELPKFNKALINLQSEQDKFLYFLKNSSALGSIPKELESLKDAFDAIDEANIALEELEIQYKRKDLISIQKLAIKKAKSRSYKNGIQEGIEKGIEEGIHKGIEKGRKEGIKEGFERGKLEAKIEFAKALLDVLDDETIAQKSGLDIELIKNLRD
jgi:predicted transposase/invertase (TIGR01784 family)